MYELTLSNFSQAWRSYNEGKLLDIADQVILDSSNEQEVVRAIEIGLLCVQEFPDDRPDMSSTVLMLASKIALPNPKRPGFYSERRESMEMNSSIRNPSSSSPSNSYSISFSWPR